MKRIKFVYIYQHGQIVKMPYWDFIMQKAKEERIKQKESPSRR